MPETYQWLLVPVQAKPTDAVGWEALRLSGTDALANRASKKLRSDELYLTSFAATRLKMELDRVPLWRGNHVPVKQLVEDFARYLYLPRLKDSGVLLKAIEDGVSLLTWRQDGFGMADGFDDVAQQMDLEKAAPPGGLVKPTQPDVPGVAPGQAADLRMPDGADWPVPAPKPVQPTRFHGSVTLDAARVGRDASKIADEVIAHLAGLVGASVTVTLEITANIPSGVSDQAVRTVTENSRTLKFDQGSGFEKE